MKKTILTFYELTWQEKAALQYEAMREQFSEEKDAAAAVPAETSPQKPSLVVNFPKAAPQPSVPPVPTGVWTDDEAEIGTAPAKQPSSSAPAAKPSATVSAAPAAKPFASAPTASAETTGKRPQETPPAKASVTDAAHHAKPNPRGNVSSSRQSASASPHTTKLGTNGSKTKRRFVIASALVILVLIVFQNEGFNINWGNWTKHITATVIINMAFAIINLFVLSSWFETLIGRVPWSAGYLIYVCFRLLAFQENGVYFSGNELVFFYAIIFSPLLATFFSSFFEFESDTFILTARLSFAIAFIISGYFVSTTVGGICWAVLSFAGLAGLIHLKRNN